MTTLLSGGILDLGKSRHQTAAGDESNWKRVRDENALKSVAFLNLYKYLTYSQ